MFLYDVGFDVLAVHLDFDRRVEGFERVRLNTALAFGVEGLEDAFRPVVHLRAAHTG